MNKHLISVTKYMMLQVNYAKYLEKILRNYQN